MLEFAMHITIESLWKLGKTKSEISRITKHDWKTVNKVIKSLENGTYPQKKPHPKTLDNHRTKILNLLEQNLSSIRIHEELQLDGVSISYSAVKRYVAEIKDSSDVHIRFHTNAGEEAQVDFGYVGLTPDVSGKRRKTWIFNMRLSYSRMDYYECVYDQKVETFIQCHINAFKFFNGVPSRIKIDNLKAAILDANFYEPVYQSLYKQFADYYGFLPFPCRVREPQEKGKVESGIKFVKNNFFAGRTFTTHKELQEKLTHWLNTKCNNRIHGTTQQIPAELFKRDEVARLKPQPEVVFSIPNVGIRIVYHDCHVYIDYCYYSVPYEYIGKEVEVEVSVNTVRISYKTQQIALHTRSRDRGKFITIASHYPKYKNILSTEYQEHYFIKMSNIGNDAGQFFLALIENNPNAWQRPISGILSLTKDYDKDVVNLACKRALVYQAFSYTTVRNICREGTYNLPLDNHVGGVQ
ncbi:MAG: IS21 family transposase [Neisseriales bacterium]|nr:MAG: IS21 family transposase [Neisseriales bacterium]